MKIFGVDHRPWPTNLKWLALLSGAGLVLVMLINQYLITPEAPQGLISYQLAGEAEEAAAIRRSWAAQGQSWATFSLYFDFLFIGVYLLFLVKLSNHLLRDRPGVREQQLGGLAKVLFIIGGTADMAENVFLLTSLANPEDETWPIVAVIATLIKLTGLLLGAACLLVVRAARRHPLTPEEHTD